MGLKNIPFWAKLSVGFGVVLLLLIIIGVMSYLNSKNVMMGLNKVQQMAALEMNLIRKEVDHLRFMDKAGQFFLDSKVASMQVETDYQRCGLGKWLYGEDRKKIEQQIPELAPILKQVEINHAGLHHSIKEINTLTRSGAKNELMPKVKEIFDFKTKEALTQVQTGLHNVGQTLSSGSEVIEKELTSKMASSQNMILLLSAGALVIGVLASLFITRSVSSTVTHLVDANEKMAQGDMQVRIPLDQNDELGRLAKTANRLSSRLATMLSRVRGSSSTIGASTTMLDRFSGELSDSSQKTAAHCQTVAVAAEQMNSNMSAIAAASEETSTNISMVAAAAEELTSTIKEIASNADYARRTTSDAVEEASSASISIHELGEAAKEINKVTEAINEIAEQTNLLALNATIEAARAGEAGKGFAVVANEIKELAQQTTNATREIQDRIDGVRSSSEKTITAINSITSTIDKSSEVVSSITDAIQEQTATTQEIAENVSQASLGMHEVNQNIAQATTANNEVTRDISQIRKDTEGVAARSLDIKELASEMMVNSASLAGLVQSFKIKDASFDIGKIKAAHFTWKMRLTSVLNGYEKLEANEIPNHHQCDFGKWYDKAPQDLRNLPVFTQIGVHHEAVHKKVAEAVSHFNAQNRAAAEKCLQEFEVERKSLFEKLDELYIS